MTLKIPNTIEKLNMYVEGMDHHAALDENYEGTITLENVPAASTDTVIDGATLVNDEPLEYVDGVLVDNFYGRNLVLTSADAAGTITVFGRDYLNQPMSEQITIASNTGTGAKAFKFIDRIETSDVPGNLDVGVGDELGIPFVGVAILREYVNGAVAGGAGALTAADTNEPSSTTGDVRGTYDPVAAPNGVSDYEIKFRFNPSAEGGLYGQAQA